MSVSFSVRLATQTDIPTLHALIESSVRTLQANDYTPAQIEGAIGTVLGLDTQLLADQTYFVAETSDSSGTKTIVACGGLSQRKTLFCSLHPPPPPPPLLLPAPPPAPIPPRFL